MEFATGAIHAVTGAFDTSGRFFPLDSLPQQINRDGAGNVTSIVATDGTRTFTQTYTYTNGNVTGISGWVRS